MVYAAAPARLLPRGRRGPALHPGRRRGAHRPAIAVKQIRALERELGAPLFQRTRGNITLTQAGEPLLPVARRILADVDTARREISELVDLRRGRVRLGATPSLCTGLLPPTAGRVPRRVPGHTLLSTKAGRATCSGRSPRRAGPRARHRLPAHADDPHSPPPPSCATNWSSPPLTHSAEPVRRPSLRDQPLVMFREGYDLRETTLAACRAAGFEPRFSVEGGEMDAVLRFVGPASAWPSCRAWRWPAARSCAAPRWLGPA